MKFCLRLILQNLIFFSTNAQVWERVINQILKKWTVILSDQMAYKSKPIFLQKNALDALIAWKNPLWNQ